MKISRYIAVLATILAIAIAGCASSTVKVDADDAENESTVEVKDVSTDSAESKDIADIEEGIDLSNVPPKFREDYINAYKKLMADKARASEHLNTAMALKKSGKLIEALGYAQTAVKLDSANKQAQALVAELRSSLGKSSRTSIISSK